MGSCEGILSMVKNVRDDMERIDTWLKAIEAMCNVAIEKEGQIFHKNWAFDQEKMTWTYVFDDEYIIRQGKDGFWLFHGKDPNVITSTIRANAVFCADLDSAKKCAENKRKLKLKN